MFGSCEFIKAGGMTFETQVAGDGEHLALCLHGFPETNLSWRHQLPMLNERGYTVWAPNLRGYGHSSRPRTVTAYRIPNLIEDVIALTDEAKRRGLRPSLLLGHDWGGAVAWLSVLTGAVTYDGFIPMNIPHMGLFRRRVFRPSQLRRSWYVLLFQFPWLAERLLSRDDFKGLRSVFAKTTQSPESLPDDVLQAFVDNARGPWALQAMLAYYRAAPLDLFSLPLTSNLTTPTLLIWGLDDVALGFEDLVPGTEALVKDLEVHPLPGVSHWVQQEAPLEVNLAIVDWLDRHPLLHTDGMNSRVMDS